MLYFKRILYLARVPGCQLIPLGRLPCILILSDTTIFTVNTAELFFWLVHYQSIVYWFKNLADQLFSLSRRSAVEEFCNHFCLILAPFQCHILNHLLKKDDLGLNHSFKKTFQFKSSFKRRRKLSYCLRRKSVLYIEKV